MPAPRTATLPRAKHAAALLLALVQAGCAAVQYYSQSITGHLEVLARRRPIAEVVEDQSTPVHVRATLEKVREMTEFAHRELLLPDNGSYGSYAQLDRAYLAWNVFAAPALSLEPLRWCFPVAGCLSYRGYFDHAAAQRFAAELRGRGLDVYVGPVTAYSTLGWFEDPVLDTMLKRGQPELARVLFHELAHQKLYIKDDTAFNEAFADTVALIGVTAWLERLPPSERERFARDLAFENSFIELVLQYRDRLQQVYRSDMDDAAKLSGKQELLAALDADYQRLKEEQGDGGTFDGWFRGGVNNARLSAVSTYRQLVPLFMERYRAADNDLRLFYAQLDGLRNCDRNARIHWLRTGERLPDC